MYCTWEKKVLELRMLEGSLVRMNDCEKPMLAQIHSPGADLKEKSASLA